MGVGEILTAQIVLCHLEVGQQELSHEIVLSMRVVPLAFVVFNGCAWPDNMQPLNCKAQTRLNIILGSGCRSKMGSSH